MRCCLVDWKFLLFLCCFYHLSGEHKLIYNYNEMEIYQKQSFKDSFKVYLDKRMLRILLLGAISGFPWVIIGSSLSLWLKEEGLSRSTIGWAGLIFAVYAFNYLWAPLIDRIRIPWLTNKVGHRRSWIILMQLIILLSLVFWNFVDPTANLSISNHSWFNYCCCFCNTRYHCGCIKN